MSHPAIEATVPAHSSAATGWSGATAAPPHAESRMPQSKQPGDAPSSDSSGGGSNKAALAHPSKDFSPSPALNQRRHNEHTGPSKAKQKKDAEAAKEKEEDAKRHQWADKLPLPYWLVAPKELREKVEAEEEEDADDDDQSGADAPSAALQLRQARVDFLRRLFAEFIGTTVLVTCHGILRIKGSSILSEGELSIFCGLTLVLLIYATGEISGAHFNPVVTLCFCLRAMFPWVWMLPYWLAQFVGALLAGGIMRGFYGQEEASLGTSFLDETSRFTEPSAMLFEAMLTFFLLYTILAVSTRGSIVGAQGALAVGAVIAMDVAMGAKITGGCMNPFRSTGPAIVNGPTDTLWVVTVGPLLGGLLAVAVTYLLSGHSKKGALKAAMGVGKSKEEDMA